MNDPRLKLGKFDIIRELVGGHITYYDEDNIVYHDGQTPPTEKEISDKRAAKQAEWDSQAYARNRKEDYPNLAEQLDYIYHNGITKWKSDMIKPVKDKYPKG